jgi:hypothetical protein
VQLRSCLSKTANAASSGSLLRSWLEGLFTQDTQACSPILAAFQNKPLNLQAPRHTKAHSMRLQMLQLLELLPVSKQESMFYKHDCCKEEQHRCPLMRTRMRCAGSSLDTYTLAASSMALAHATAHPVVCVKPPGLISL